MCGIAGLYLTDGSELQAAHELPSKIRRMTARLTARGPDAFGHLVRTSIAFGHRRLSILDLTDAGAQPMQLDDNGPMITYNGEVYNFRELRRELEAKGCFFRGQSDTEVILQVYTVWGLDGLKRLEGIFAFALLSIVSMSPGVEAMAPGRRFAPGASPKNFSAPGA